MSDYKIVTGTFLDGISCDIPSNNWGDEEWSRQFDVMKNMGMDTTIVIRVGYKDSAMYKSEVMQTTLYEENDLLETMFREADRTGIKMYLGLFDTEKHWIKNDWQPEIDINERVIDEMCERYQSHPSFYGWYLSHEGDIKFHQTKIWIPLIKKIKSIDPSKPIIISPRYAGIKYEPRFNVTPEIHYRHFDYIFNELEGTVDAAAFMDGHVEFYELKDFVAATHEICKKHGVAFWSNLETFDRDLALKWPPIEWMKMKHKLEVVQPYVEKIITFEAPHFLSPYSTYPSAHGLYKRYLDFISDKGVHLDKAAMDALSESPFVVRRDYS